MFGTKTVPPLEGRKGDSSGAEAEPLSRGGRRVSRCFCPPCVQDSVPFLFIKSIHITIIFVSNRHCIFPWLGYDPFNLCHSVIPYGYVC